ncbi:hypothetical protein FT663_01870 [Candidozyma haemuli var. vulneris]|uniref:Enoyl reductase (ER) domain-containing protein n=1 Tax=Candidozyma haemuli TaxID=45357 RepID=A0A2V1APL6_9ASCO|nr:hypothetical protein CXQ85_003322 [[Candida] haemuloni]KAF3985371.1 hypothetical protein FT662_05185 [[Candida] haemuloni var. vulneris]KAF3993366.1 hypothetical protein FT663_01870 [[Candida] haemuloni var. vulneris]PVH19476.1 hypothetical protein CXQ85_003322 [[Candida] haemuloni]
MSVENPAFILKSVKNVVFENRPIKPLQPKEVRVHINQTGICGSDVHYWQRGRIGKFVMKDGKDMVLGHESSGTVVELGSEVTTLKKGDRVSVEPGVPCRYCDLCRDGKYNMCEDMVFAATPPWDGTLQRFYNVAYDYCYKIPDTMDMEEAALVEPVTVAVQACKRAKLKGRDFVVVFGCGPIGLLCQAVAKALGCKKVIGVDISDGRLEFAKTFGADGVFKMPTKKDDEGAEDYSKRVSALIKEEFDIGECGADVILEATGAEPCIQTGVFLARHEGRFVQTGMGKEFVSFPVTEALVKQLNWTGTIRYSTGCYPTAVDLVASGKIDVKRLVTNRFKFEEAEKAFDLVKEGRTDVIKVMIEGVTDETKI